MTPCPRPKRKIANSIETGKSCYCLESLYFLRINSKSRRAKQTNQSFSSAKNFLFRVDVVTGGATGAGRQS